MVPASSKLPRPTAIAGNRRQALLGVVVIAAAIAAAYFPALRAGFVWDDDTFLTANPLIKAPDGLHRLWLSNQGIDYWPLTSTTLWLEWRAWGLNPLGYHATNLALHLSCTLSLWWVLWRLRVPGSFLAALIFAVHPVNVESVAWITQRKNLVAMFFALLSILAFLQGDRDRAEPGTPLRRPGLWYACSLAAFALAMLGKTSVALLPIVLLGCLAWKRRLVLRDFLRLAPFVAVSAALTVVTLEFQRRAMDGAARHAGAIERILGAAAALWFYLLKALAPVHLSFIYPRWIVRPGDPRWWVPLLGAVALTLALWRRRRHGSRALLFAWGFFCVALLPALGLTDFGFMKYSLVGNHYEHLAIIGVIAPAAAGWEIWRRRAAVASGAAWPLAAAAAVVLTFGALTWRQCETYRDAETLYRATLRANPAAWMAHNNLGILLAEKGRTAEAMGHFEAAVQLNPDWPEAHSNLGMVLQQAGRKEEAMDQYREALRLQPDFRRARIALAALLAAAGRFPEATVHDQLAFVPADTAAAHCELGEALVDEGRISEALVEYRAALRLDPSCQPALDRIRQLTR